MFQVAAVSDLFDAGKDNDGQVFAAEVYYVVIENGAGRRWASYDRFRGARREVDEEGWVSFDDLREAASAAADRRCWAEGARSTAAIAIGDPGPAAAGSSCWHPGGPTPAGRTPSPPWPWFPHQFAGHCAAGEDLGVGAAASGYGH